MEPRGPCGGGSTEGGSAEGDSGCGLRVVSRTLLDERAGGRPTEPTPRVQHLLSFQRRGSWAVTQGLSPVTCEVESKRQAWSCYGPSGQLEKCRDCLSPTFLFVV